MSDQKPTHTPGPWHWNVNPASKLVRMLAANGDYVLFARRWGNSGTLFFQKPSSGIIENASAYLKDFPNRHHHRSWAQTIDHPDAHLIAAAPDLLEALEDFLTMHTDLAESGDCGNWDLEKDANVIAARAAIAKAKGETP